MRAVFEHSWQLLPAEEQQVLRRLAVFRGGFTRAAAAEVAGTSLVVLAALVDKSLVRRGGERYDLHEVVRQGAMTHLEQDVGEATATRDRHAAYFMGLLADRDQVLKSPAQRAAVVELTAEIDNVRVGWQWAAQRRRLADLRQALPTLFYFYEIRSWYQEAQALFRQAAEVLQAMHEWEPGTDEAARILLGELLALQGWFAFRYSAFNLARELAERSLMLLGPDSTAAALAEALPWLWPVRPFGQDYDAGARLLQRRIALLRARGDRWGEAGARLHLGALRQSQGDQREAYRVLRESLALYRATGDPVIVARSLGFVANAAYALEEYDEARHYAQESLEISRGLDDHFSMGLALHTLGQVAHREGRYRDARRLLEESMQRSLALGYRWDIAPVLTSLARTLQALGAAAEAQRAFLESLAASQDMPGTVRVIETVLGLAGLLDEQDETELALALSLHILGHPVSRPRHREQAERLRARLEAALHAEEVAEIEERVQAQSLEDVVAELLARFPPASS
jgi:tetratricopeptide (TPR) repeat protein